MNSSFRTFLVSALLLSAGPIHFPVWFPLAHAQDPGAAASVIRADQARQARDQRSLRSRSEVDEVAGGGIREVAPPGGFEENDDYGTQEILVRRTEWEPWNVIAQAGVFWTDNAALTTANEIDDFYFYSGALISYTPRIVGNLFGDFSISQYFYLYDELDVLDFDIFEADAGFLYIFQNFFDVTAFGRYGYDRITDSGFGDEVYTNHGITLGLQKVFRFTRGQAFTLGYSSKLTIDGDPEIAQRDEHAVFAAYTAQWFEKFLTAISYRGAFYDYDELGRDDWNHSIVFLAEYEFFEWLSLQATTSYTYNASNLDVFDYSNWILGGTINLIARF